MPVARIELDEGDIKRAILNYIEASLGLNISISEVEIQVKSKQNYKSEWEEAAIRAHFTAKPGAQL